VVAVVLVVALLGGYILLRQGQQGAGTSTSTPSASTSSTTTAVTPAPLGGEWLTYHHDANRTGLDSSDAPLHSPALAWSSQRLDGAIYAEPLVFSGMVFVSTENDTVFALNVTSGQVVWRNHLGQPVSGSTLPCGDINPSGITSTPVIDPTTQSIYVTAFLHGEGHVLFSIDAANGEVRWSHTVDPPGSDPSVEQQRAALSTYGGVVYVPFGGLDGDCGSYHGYLVGYPANGTGRLLSYQVPSGNGAGVWGPSGAAVDPRGEILIATGNSFSTTSFDYGDSVISLSPALKVSGYFAPSNWADLNAGDTDLGSVGPALLPNNIVFQIGKSGVGYLLRSTELAGVDSQLYSGQVCGGGAYGGTAYAAPLLYVPCTSGLVAVSVNASSPTFQVLWRGPGFHAGPPVVAGGAVWTLSLDTGDIYALNAETGNVVFKTHLGGFAHFATPSAADGFVFVASGDQVDAIALST
jgi:polyvinyl alcohol dehydrogenase (cytochrome)